MGAVQGVQLMVGILLGTGCWWAIISGITAYFRGRITDTIFGVLNRLLGSLMMLFGLIMILRCLLTN